MAPKPIFRFLADILLKASHIALHNAILRCLLGMFAEQIESHRIASTFHFVDTIVEHGVIVFSGKIFSAIEEGGILVEKGGPIGFVGMCRRLVAEHHQSTGNLMFVVERDHIADSIGIDHLGAEASAATEHPRFQKFVAQGLPHPDTMMEKLHVERSDHILPTVVMGRHQHHTPTLLVVAGHQIAVGHTVALHYPAPRGEEIPNTLDKDIAEVMIETVFELTALLLAFLRERNGKVASHHLGAVTQNLIGNQIDYVGN